MHCLKGFIMPGLLLGILSLAQPFLASAEAMKTYLKQYSIFTYENQDYLCEPYQVKKNDWLYKIFRQKGEISAEDFPKFLSIFRTINPKLSNIDAIEPGNQVLIPLKRISRNTYKEKQKGIVEVPVLSFSADLKEEKLAAFIKKHTIQRGDTVSTLLDRAFLEKGGTVSETGKKVFAHLNPKIRDIDRIYLGSQVLIPDPAILNQPWFKSFFASGETTGLATALPQKDLSRPQQKMHPLPTLPEMPPEDLIRLKRYAQLIHGALQHQGQMIFPGKDKGPSNALDLTRTPILTGKDGKKTLILPPGTGPEEFVDTDLVEGMKKYWKELRIQELNQALANGPSLFSKKQSLDDTPKDPIAVIQTVLKATSLSLQPAIEIPIQVGPVGITANLARIVNDRHPDILLNPGTIYGTALDALKSKGNEVLTISQGMTTGEIVTLVFSTLGFTTWKNPAVNNNGRITPLTGIYATRAKDKLFVTRTGLSNMAKDFMTAESITIIRLMGD